MIIENITEVKIENINGKTESKKETEKRIEV